MTNTKQSVTHAPDVSTLNPGVAKREVWAWAMFDFANSGYTTVVLTAIFNAYFVGVIAGKAEWATLAWTLALSLSYLLVILSAPILGAYADLRAGKKRILVWSTVGCVICTALLALAGPGSLTLAIVLIVLSNVFYVTTQDIYSAFLPELARPESMGKVSGWAWAWGYMGGIVTLGACLAYVTWAQAHQQSATQFVPVTNLITAVIFGLAALPAILFLKERAQPVSHEGGLISAAFARFGQTLREASRFRDLRNFLICIVAYQAGVQTVITLAAVYAQEAMGFTMQQTLILVLVVNVTAAIGAFFFGYLQDAVGHWKSIFIVICAWIGMIIVAWFATTSAVFWVAANLAGLAMGASQSAARALVSYLSPNGRQGEFLGLWGVAGNAAAIVGPVTYGLVTWLTGNNHRLAMLATGAFFLLGIAILFSVNVERGRQAALESY
jgi:MFS transporter, UMF1 family